MLRNNYYKKKIITTLILAHIQMRKRMSNGVTLVNTVQKIHHRIVLTPLLKCSREEERHYTFSKLYGSILLSLKERCSCMYLQIQAAYPSGCCTKYSFT